LGRVWANPTLARNLYSEPCTINNGRKRCFFKKYHIIALGSQQTTVNNKFSFKTRHCNALDSPKCFVSSTMPRRIYSKDYWFSKYGLYGQSCHGRFTVKITDSLNMVCMVNHVTEDLQWRLLILQIWFVWSTMPQRIYSIEY